MWNHNSLFSGLGYCVFRVFWMNKHYENIIYLDKNLACLCVLGFNSSTCISCSLCVDYWPDCRLWLTAVIDSCDWQLWLTAGLCTDWLALLDWDYWGAVLCCRLRVCQVYVTFGSTDCDRSSARKSNHVCKYHAEIYQPGYQSTNRSTRPAFSNMLVCEFPQLLLGYGPNYDFHKSICLATFVNQ